MKNGREYFLKLVEKFGSSRAVVLDLACGTGSLSMELARRGCDVIGVDISEDMLSVARGKSVGASGMGYSLSVPAYDRSGFVWHGRYDHLCVG